MACYYIQYSKNATSSYEENVYRCVSFCIYHASGSAESNGPWLECPDLLWDRNTAAVSTGRVTLIDNDCTACGSQPPPPPPDLKYDCLNGGCIPKTTYNTPGVFPSLAACQSGCAKNSNCTGECVSADELAALQQAAGTVRSRLCS